MSTDLYQIVHRAIVSRVRGKIDMHGDLKEAILKSEVGRQRMCILAKNLTDKIKSEQNWFVLEQHKIEMLAWTFTDWFIHTFKVVADQKAMSHFEQEKIKAEAEKFKGLDAQGNGFIEELGVKVVEGNHEQKES